jgi:hypothetical protein
MNITMKRFACIFGVTLALVACSTSDKVDIKGSEEALVQLHEGWENPPQSARTRVWWHWMNGNITKDGLKKDLEWMHRIGLGGYHNFDAAFATKPIVEKRLIYMEPDWKDAFAYAIQLSDSLGLEATIASSPGWSTTGGPWVEPKDAMKKLVWRTMNVQGGQAVKGQLPAPFKTTGSFQNGPVQGRGQAAKVADYYEDIAVMAVKRPEGAKSLAELGAKITSSGGNFSIAALNDDDIMNSTLLPSNPNGDFAWIQYEFPEAQTMRSVTIVDGSTGGYGSSRATTALESSNDGKTFTKVCDLPAGRVRQRTLSIPVTTAKYFRFTFQNPRTPQATNMFGGSRGPAPVTPKGTEIAELGIYPYSKVNRFEDKGGWAAIGNASGLATPASPDEIFAKTTDVVDITDKVDAQGNLDWDAPAGNWKIYRFGWSLTGKQNHPATAEATGLEVDKLDPEAWTRYFHHYFDMYKDASNGMLGQKGIQYVLNDSYEAEQENWTPAMFEAFKSHAGYDLKPWLPVLAGEVIGSPEESDAFLWDWRMTISDLIAENYDLLTKIAQDEYDMKGRYTESHEAGRAFVVDGMDVKRTSQVPMSAMWVTASWLPNNPDGTPNRSMYNLDGLESASVANIYGQNVVATESMTAPGQGGLAYSYHPGNLKFLADIEMSNGTNRFVIHESAHQPVDDKVPGLSLGGIGQWFNRHETWAEQAKVWVDYMSRSCFMLQAGRNVADILDYYGEDDSVISVYGSTMPDSPFGYRYDFASPDVLLNRMTVKNGELVSTAGTTYKVLWLDKNQDYMSVPILRRIAEFADKGIVICGSKPKHPAGLMDDRAEFDSLVQQIWGSGRQNVTEGVALSDVLKNVGIEPDFSVNSRSEFRYLHRTFNGAEIYWVNKPSMEYETVEASFRTTGLKPRVWHPDAGVIEDATYRVENGRTIVTLELVPDDAVFVVFAGAGETSFTVPAVTETQVATVSTPWTVKFQENRGAPTEAEFPVLKDYRESREFGIKYFSGIASYNNTIALQKADGKVFIDLGEVHDLAEVWLNGQYCGTAWKTPFKVDVTDAVKDGENSLEIKVVNVWVNRLIGDEQPDCPEKITYVDSRAYRADSPLKPAGLIGPVSFRVETAVK